MRTAGTVLWRDIAERLATDIRSGAWAVGERLPPEEARATRFGVNRHTVRHAAVEENLPARLPRTADDDHCATRFLDPQGWLPGLEEVDSGKLARLPEALVHRAGTPHSA